MQNNAVALDSQSTRTIELPAEVAALLQNEARRSRKSIAECIMQWLEDQADGREAARISKRIKAGKEKVYPAKEVWARHGI
jgi:predicted DNA-binding protein